MGAELSKSHRFADSFAVNSTENFFDLLSQLRAAPSLYRHEAIDIVSRISTSTGTTAQRYRQEDALFRSLESALMIWTNLSIHVWQRPAPSTSTTLLWLQDDVTLRDVIDQHFENARRSIDMKSFDTKSMDPKLTMEHLSSAYGYKPLWTSNLAEHLKIDHKYKTIIIFEHKINLWNHSRFCEPQRNSMPLPTEVIDEALDTLNLLFPWGDEATKSFLQRHKKSFYGLGKCNRERQLDLSAYRYWRNEISELAEILSQPPRGRAQFLIDSDGNNLLEVWTFWTAIFFGILAVIGVITGVYSMVYSKLAYDVGVLQYQLALAQACSAENATDVLPGFCS